MRDHAEWHSNWQKEAGFFSKHAWRYLVDTIYYPIDRAFQQPDCETLPFLMQLALAGKANQTSPTGVAADVGASTGNCAFLLLSHGHEVHLFDSRLDVQGSYEREVIDMTVRANRWSEQAHYHDLLSNSHSLDDVFRTPLDLLKIDVDYRNEYELVLSGQESLLKRTTIAQVELIESELGLEGMYFVVDFFRSSGFDAYTFQAKDALGRPHWSLAAAVGERGLEEKCGDPLLVGSDHPTFHRAPVTRDILKRGFVLYGENAMWDIRLDPLCFCQGKTLLPLKEECRFRLAKQVALVRRGTLAHEEVTRRFGGCRCKREL